MKKLLLQATAFFGLFAFTACDSDDKVTLPEENETPANRCYIVNTGNWEGNDASIQYYSFDNDMATAGDSEANIFAVQNKTLLGDLAQDLLWTKEKLFVTVSGSQKIEVLDESGKVIMRRDTLESAQHWAGNLHESTKILTADEFEALRKRYGKC